MFKLKINVVRMILFALVLTFLPSICLAIPILNPTTGNYYDIVSSGSNGSWINAENNAIALGAQLVTINDAAEEAWLRATFSRTTRYWIGFNDSASEGNWVWSSGETPGYTHWNGGEPNNVPPPSYGEDFAVLNWNTSNGAWNDWDHLRPDYYNISGIAEYAPIPEPGTIFLLSIGLICLVFYHKKRGINNYI